jgi:hypothetical protein
VLDMAISELCRGQSAFKASIGLVDLRVARCGTGSSKNQRHQGDGTARGFGYRFQALWGAAVALACGSSLERASVGAMLFENFTFIRYLA